MEVLRAARLRALWRQHALLTLIALLCTVSLVLLVTTDSTLEWPFRSFHGAGQLRALVYGALGYFIAVRRPGLLVGWLILGGAVVAATYALTFELIFRGLSSSAAVPGGGLTIWLAVWLPTLNTMLLLVVPAVFPDGPLHARRWRIALWAQVALGIASVLVVMVVPHPVVGDLVSPTVILALAPLRPIAFSLFDGLQLASVVLGVGSLVARYRPATPMVRQQLKWLMATLVLILVVNVAELIALSIRRFELLPVFNVAYLVITFAVLPAAAGIAILRYRLFDIDVIINRALVYGGVSAVLAGAFAGLSTAAQYILRSMTGQQSEIVSIVLAILATAAFAPLKARVQAIVDRRLKESPTPVGASRIATL